MGKQSVSIKGTSVSNGNAVGNHVEQTLYMEDNLLPSPSELQAYKNIEPKIVDFLLESSMKEQAHRHKMDEEKMKVVKYTERKNGRMNWWGMFFAFLALILMVGLSAFALYLDKPWFAGIFGFSAVLGIISTFVNAGNKTNK